MEIELKKTRDELITMLEDDAITVDDVRTSTTQAGTNSEAIQSAVDRVVVKRKKNGLPVGVKTDRTGKKPNKPTAKMLAFASYVLNGDAPREAYRKAYDCSGSADATIIARANELMRHSSITLLLEPLITAKKELVLANEIATRKHIMEELFKHSDNEETNVGARLRALELMGKAVGMFIDKVETKVEEINAEQLKQELESHLTLLDNVTSIKKKSA
jgi:hypothetical protein